MSTNTIEISAWETCSIRQLMTKVNEAVINKKWLFVWDKLGTANTFFKYSHRLCEFQYEFRAYSAGRQSCEDTLKVMRDAMVSV